MRVRLLGVTFAFVLGSLCAHAQLSQINASNIVGGDGRKLAHGEIDLYPVTLAGAPIQPQLGGGGVVLYKPAQCIITNGVIISALDGSACTTTDTALTNPAHFCYKALIKDTSVVPSLNLPPIRCIQPTGQYWNLDTQYTPDAQPTGLVTLGPPGPPGPSASGVGVIDISGLTGTTWDGKLNSCLTMIGGEGGICDGRAFTTDQVLSGPITIGKSNTVVRLPCVTINDAYPVYVQAGIRNVSIQGCSYQGGSNSNGGGTQWVFLGMSGPAFQVGDPTYAADTKGFHMENLRIDTSSATGAAVAFRAYRTQEIDLRSVYFTGPQNLNQIGIFLDGTGNYTGGTFDSIALTGYGEALHMTGHQSGSVSGDYANASTFLRLHIDCPTSGGNPISGSYGINLDKADGNTWVGGDVEGCDTMFHLGTGAVNNTVVGLRNENSNMQYVADGGSSFNSVITGGTFFTNRISDAGSRNSFSDAFHRTQNGVNGDWYASQIDATVVNHLRLGTGTGNVRGLQWESQVDQGTASSVYNWLWGLTDGTSGQQQWVYQDLINSTQRLILAQNNTAGGNNQTALNAAGTGNVCFQCSNNSGTGGVAFGSGGASPSTVATIDGNGNETLYGYKRFFAGGAEAWRFNCASSSSCAVDSWTSGSPVHHLRLYNGSGTEIDSEGTAAVTVNNTATSGTGGFIVYQGGANYNTQAFSVGSGGYTKVSNLAGTGHRCVYADNAGGLNVETTDCGSGNGNGNGTVTQVAMSVPSDESVGGSPITGSGTLAITRNNQAANLFLAGPCSGSATTPLYRLLCANDLPAATSSAQGAVILPSGASSNQLGSAAMQPTTAFDAAGAAAAAQAASVPTSTTINGHSLSSNVVVSASDLTTGTLPHAQLPALQSADIPANTANTTGTAGGLSANIAESQVTNLSTDLAGKVTKTNMLGCLDGYDHLPCAVYNQPNVSESAQSGSYATVFTTTAAGVYRVNGYTYSTVCGTSTAGNMTATQYVKAAELGSTGASGATVSSWQVGSSTTSCSSGVNYSVLYNLASGVAIQTETLMSISSSGTQSNAATWSRAVEIERLQ